MIEIEKYKKSMKVASYDDTNDESLIGDEREEVYVLDDIAKEIAQKLEMDIPSSCDSVVVKEDDIYLIEFKNQEYGNITPKEKRAIRKKAYQSRELLLSTFLKEKTLRYVAEHVHLFVVFKSMEIDSKSYGMISAKLNSFANGNKPEIKCKLAKFEGTFYKEVYTIGKEEFESVYLPQILSD